MNGNNFIYGIQNEGEIASPSFCTCSVPLQLRHFFIISTANQIVNAGFIIICKADQHFDWNVPGASFVVGVGTLADVKDITDLLLGQISVCPKVLNSLKFHRFTSFSSVESTGTKCNEQRLSPNPFRKYKSERNALLQFRAKWAIMNFVYLLIISFLLLFFFIPETH